MDIGFVRRGMIDAEGVGSVQTATRLVYGLADAGHDVTAYCITSSPDAASDVASLPAGIDVEPITIPERSHLPPGRYDLAGKALVERAAQFEAHDVVHSYVSAIAALGKVRREVSTPVVVTLNGYGPVCPKRDIFYKDVEPCRENGRNRCTKCILTSTLRSDESDAFDGASVFDTYDGVKRIPATGYLLAKRFRALRTVLDIQEAVDQMDAYHVQSDHLVDIFSSFGFPEDRFRTVPNLLDERFEIPSEADFREPYRLLYVGSLYKKKGVQKLVPMMEYLNETYDVEYELTVVGSGYLQSHLEEQARESKATVRVVGRIPYDEVPGVYASHDVFVYPGIWEEPFARVFLEALATGTPIVGSDVGTLERIVGDAGVVTDGSVEGLGDGVYELSDHDKLIERSERAKQRAKRYRPEEVIPQLVELYRDTIASVDGRPKAV